MEYTADVISQLDWATTSDDTIKYLIDVAQNEPDDMTRVVASCWIRENAIRILTRVYSL